MSRVMRRHLFGSLKIALFTVGSKDPPWRPRYQILRCRDGNLIAICIMINSDNFPFHLTTHGMRASTIDNDAEIFWKRTGRWSIIEDLTWERNRGSRVNRGVSGFFRPRLFTEKIWRKYMNNTLVYFLSFVLINNNISFIFYKDIFRIFYTLIIYFI